MPRATWEGQLIFGVISVPVALISGVKNSDLEFHLVDARDQSRIRYIRVNEDTGEEVPEGQVVRAYQYEDGNYVLLNDQDFQQAAAESNRTIEIDSFVNSDEIDPAYFEKPYVLVPRKGAEKTYVLLREALQGTGKIAIARVVMRSREYLMALFPQGSAIIADRMRFPQEVRTPEELDLPSDWLKEYGISAKELSMAEKLVKALATDWQPQKYHDEYRESLLDWIDKKVRTGEVSPAPEEEPEPQSENQPENLLNLLERSLEKTKEQ